MLGIPTVTQDDLYAFHARVFKSATAPVHLMPTEENIVDIENLEDADREFEDDLGYYPDGVKRTLTDDQIAMFRHSEIYSILREKQVRQENREIDGDEPPEGQLSDVEEATQANVSSANVRDTLSSNCVQSPGLASERGTQKNIGDICEQTPGRDKRKRHKVDSGGTKSQRFTFRRAARELDSVMADDSVLDYGDDRSNTVESHTMIPGNVSAVASSAPVPSILGGSTVMLNPLIEGKKIWWPVIGP